MGSELLMIFVIKKRYDPHELLNFMNRLNNAQHENFWEFFSGFRIYAEINGKELIVRKKSTQVYFFALIWQDKGIWKGVSCSKDKQYLEKQVSTYYSNSITQILPVKVGLIVKRDYKSLTQINVGV